MSSMKTSKDSLLKASLKDAFFSALLTLVLTSLILGVKIVDINTGLKLEPRFWLAGLAVALVFIGRFALHMFWWSRKPRQTAEKKPARSRFPKIPHFGKYAAPVLIFAAIALPFMPFSDRYIIDLFILILTYVMLGWGLNIVVGYAGLLDLGYVAFYAVGAYSFALLATYLDLTFWECLPLAGLLAATWGVILGFPVLRLRGDYLAIVTLAFGEIIRIVLLNWYSFTGGPDGISGIPRPSFFGLEFKRFGEGTFAQFFGLEFSSIHRIIFLYYVILTLALITAVVTIRLRNLPIGRAWEALREDQIACSSLGINTTTTKLTAFAMGAMFGGFAGSFFAARQGFISPESFTFIESAIILAIVVLGGMGSQIGVVIASVALIGGFEVFREFEQYRMLIFGGAMVVIMVWRPRGLITTRHPSVRLHPPDGPQTHAARETAS